MPSNPRYKINASEIEVVDKNSVFQGQDVESVLFEIYKINAQAMKYETLIEEVPQGSSYNFIQDDDLQAYRENTNTNLVFNGTGHYIGVMAGAIGSVPQKTVFTSKKNILYPMVQTKVTFRNNGDSVSINIKKVDGKYYSFVMQQGTFPKLYYFDGINPIGTLIGSAGSPILAKNRQYDFIGFIYNTKLYFALDGVTSFNTTNVQITTSGKFEIIANCTANGNEIDIGYIKVGSFVYESKNA